MKIENLRIIRFHNLDDAEYTDTLCDGCKAAEKWLIEHRFIRDSMGEWMIQESDGEYVNTAYAHIEIPEIYR